VAAVTATFLKCGSFQKLMTVKICGRERFLAGKVAVIWPYKKNSQNYYSGTHFCWSTNLLLKGLKEREKMYIYGNWPWKVPNGRFFGLKWQ
jgi:hypothetical protein